MGMYTQLFLSAELKADITPEVVEALEYMTSTEDRHYDGLDHELFHTERWRWMLHAGSAYFPEAVPPRFSRDEYSGQYDLFVLTNLKNYGGEIEAFLDWIKPYLHEWNRDVIGWTWYEEADEPTLIRKDEI